MKAEKKKRKVKWIGIGIAVCVVWIVVLNLLYSRYYTRKADYEKGSVVTERGITYQVLDAEQVTLQELITRYSIEDEAVLNSWPGDVYRFCLITLQIENTNEAAATIDFTRILLQSRYWESQIAGDMTSYFNPGSEWYTRLSLDAEEKKTVTVAYCVPYEEDKLDMIYQDFYLVFKRDGVKKRLLIWEKEA